MKPTITLFLLCASFMLQGQSTCITYSHKQGGEQYVNMVLFINDSSSFWNAEIDTADVWGDNSFFIKDYNTNQLYYNRGLFNKNVFITDSLYPMQWELASDTAIILNETCYSAKAHFRGRDYTAFYAPGLSGTDGPWKFGGLPGLILQLKASDGGINYTAVKLIRNCPNTLPPVNIKKQDFLRWDKFTTKFITIITNAVKTVNATETDVEDLRTTIKVSGETEIFYPDAQDEDGITFY